MFDIYAMQATDYASSVDRTGFNPDRIVADRADQHLAVLDRMGQVRARCSLWWRETTRVDGGRMGAIGHFAACDGPFGQQLVEHACTTLKQHNCELAVGPLDGNTWRRYRFVTERGTEQPFFLEPDNPDTWPALFSRCGFLPLATYVSELNPDIAGRRPELGDLRARMIRAGVRIDPFDTARPDADIDGIHSVASESFKSAYLYTPLDNSSYRDLYAPVLRQIEPNLLLIARQAGEVVGFVFAPPDILQHNYRDRVDAIVIKTVAVLPRDDLRGLGRVLIVELLENALELGFTRAISALMQEHNRSRSISRHCAFPMRRYTLFARGLRE